MLDRQERRATEMAEFKEKTKNFMRTFEAKATDIKPTDKSDWLSNHTVELTVLNIGVAFPLSLNHGLQLPHSSNVNATTVKAFLFSIKSLKFATQRGETGQALMEGFSFQFVSR